MQMAQAAGSPEMREASLSSSPRIPGKASITDAFRTSLGMARDSAASASSVAATIRGLHIRPRLSVAPASLDQGLLASPRGKQRRSFLTWEQGSEAPRRPSLAFAEERRHSVLMSQDSLTTARTTVSLSDPSTSLPMEVPQQRLPSERMQDLLVWGRMLCKHRYFRALMFMCVAAAILFPDLWILADRADNQDLDVFLTFVLAIFLFEVMLQSAVVAHYAGSSLFWMDLVGAASLLLDLSYLPMYSISSGASHSVVLTARITKLAARAARLGRVVKLLRFLPGAGRDTGTKCMATAISWRLNTLLSFRAACLMIILVVVQPSITAWSYPKEDGSMDSWMLILEGAGLAAPVQLQEQIAEMERFYAGLSYFPYRLEHSFPGAIGLWESGDGRGAPHRHWNSRRLQTAHLTCDFNFCSTNRLAAAMNMTLHFTVVLMVALTQVLLANSVSTIMGKPLKKLLDRLAVASKQIFASVEKMADTVQGAKDPGRRTSHSGDPGQDAGSEAEAEAAEAEMELLEAVLERLASVAACITGAGDGGDQVAELSGEDRSIGMQIMNSYKLGYTTQDRWTKSSPVSLDVQVSMLQNVGLSLDLVNSWYFNPLELDKVRCHAACSFFLGTHNHGVEINPTKLQLFIEAMEGAYLNVPYHSWFHAVDVTHSVYRLLRILKCDHFLGRLEQLALLVSATGHDIGHPGLSNQFLMETSHELALRYNDRSPLENMHCMRLFEILAVPRTSILETLNTIQLQEVRRVCVEAILHTDNAGHFKMVKELQLFYEMHSDLLDDSSGFFSVDPSDFPSTECLDCFESEEARELLWRLLLHAADLSNPTRPFRICRIWAQRVLEEFFAQGDLELAAGLPVPALHDREKADSLYSQIGFIEFLVAPLLLAAVKLLPSYGSCVEQLLDNMRHWQERWVVQSKPSDQEAQAVEDRIQKLEKRFVQGK